MQHYANLFYQSKLKNFTLRYILERIVPELVALIWIIKSSKEYYSIVSGSLIIQRQFKLFMKVINKERIMK